MQESNRSSTRSSQPRSPKPDRGERRERRRRSETGSSSRHREGGDRRRKGRSHSAPPHMGAPRSCLRVKSQTQSLRTRGLATDPANKHVDFAFLEVREYPMVLGDNPSCMEGPPITIDWGHDPNTQFVLDVNTFERMRGRRRNAIELVMSKETREKWLLDTGTTRKEIAQVVRQVRKEKHARMVSNHNQHMDNVNESLEKATSGIKKLFVFKKSDYEKSLQQAQHSQGASNAAADAGIMMQAPYSARSA